MLYLTHICPLLIAAAPKFFSYAPTEICEAIYGGITGAKYDSSLGQWTLPCDAEIDMALQFK